MAREIPLLNLNTEASLVKKRGASTQTKTGVSILGDTWQDSQLFGTLAKGEFKFREDIPSRVELAEKLLDDNEDDDLNVNVKLVSIS